MSQTRAVFLDRDGVINKKMAVGEYVSHPDEFELLPGVVDALKMLRRKGFLLVVVTNQRGIAKGKMGHGDVLAVHRRMSQLFADEGVFLDGVHYCPCEPGPTCDCRKPKPGMILRGAERFGIDLSSSWMVGDNISDVTAGNRAGCRSILIDAALSQSGLDETEVLAEETPITVVDGLLSAAQFICGDGEPGSTAQLGLDLK